MKFCLLYAQFIAVFFWNEPPKRWHLLHARCTAVARQITGAREFLESQNSESYCLLSDVDVEIVSGALEVLAAHKLAWSEGESAMYEQALRALGFEVEA